MKPGRSWLPESRGSLAASFAASVAFHAAVLALYGCVFVSPARYGMSTLAPDESGSILNITSTELAAGPAPRTGAMPEEAAVSPPITAAEAPPSTAAEPDPDTPIDPLTPKPEQAVAGPSASGNRIDGPADASPAAASPASSIDLEPRASAGRIPAVHEGSARARPDYLRNPHPVYPPAARRAGLQGTVLLEVRLDEHGTVTDLRVKSSSGHPVLDRAATKSVGRWRFLPARIGPVPVGSTVEIPVRFQLD